MNSAFFPMETEESGSGYIDSYFGNQALSPPTAATSPLSSLESAAVSPSALRSAQPGHFPSLRDSLASGSQQSPSRPDPHGRNSYPPVTHALRMLQDQPPTGWNLARFPKGYSREECSPDVAYFHVPASLNGSLVHAQTSPADALISPLMSPPVSANPPALLHGEVNAAEISRKPLLATTGTSKSNRDNRSVRGRRVPHHLVERRYRENLNGQIEALRLVIPSLKDADAQVGDVDDPSIPTRMPSKTAIITAAVEHINELHAQEARFRHTVDDLQALIQELQNLVSRDDCVLPQYLESLELEQGQTNST